jgi:hypothetical protein
MQTTKTSIRFGGLKRNYYLCKNNNKDYGTESEQELETVLLHQGGGRDV